MRVLDFLKATINDTNCVGITRSECIEEAADVIIQVTYPGTYYSVTEIADKIGASIIENGYDGIDTLLHASEEYVGGEDALQLRALYLVWNALMNIILSIRDKLNNKHATLILNSGLDIIVKLKTIATDVVSKIVGNIFVTFEELVQYDNVTKEQFEEKKILSKCIGILKKNDEWHHRSESVMQEAIEFFDWCRDKHFFSRIPILNFSSL